MRKVKRKTTNSIPYKCDHVDLIVQAHDGPKLMLPSHRYTLIHWKCKTQKPITYMNHNTN